MYENHKQPIKPRSEFTKRQIKNIVLGLLITFASLFIGMWGYHYFESMDWTDAYVNAAMILAGMGPVDTLKNRFRQIVCWHLRPFLRRDFFSHTRRGAGPFDPPGLASISL